MDYMKDIWPRLKNLNLNTVIASVSGELIEPEEGKFDFSTLDELIADAGKYDLKLVLLWFGSWKNSASTYTPAWVRQDLKRFPRVQNRQSENLNAISCFSEEACKADAKAFGQMLKHLKETDGREHTVVCIQVENEAGVKKTSRDLNRLFPQN
jgi:beta-galactosidase GanA